jgi:hypothetical protein
MTPWGHYAQVNTLGEGPEERGVVTQICVPSVKVNCAPLVTGSTLVTEEKAAADVAYWEYVSGDTIPEVCAWAYTLSAIERAVEESAVLCAPVMILVV